MNDYKSIQDLIVKAALYDKVSTTIGPDELVGGRDTIRIIFQKNNRYSTVYLFLNSECAQPEDAHLYNCKRALYKLLEAPYDEIEVNKENHQ